MKKIVPGFTIDENNKVSCSSCRLPCRSVRLSDQWIYTCHNGGCKNKLEVIRDLETGEWTTGPAGSAWKADEVQDFLMEFLLQSPGLISPKIKLLAPQV